MRILSVLIVIIALVASSYTLPKSKIDQKSVNERVETPSTSSASEEASDGIQFENISFKDALEKAKKENKLIFMDAFTVWCGPCKMLDRSTFKSQKVGKAFNTNFINIKVDMEKGEGPALARQYQVRAYPTMMLINGEGKVVKKILGFVPEDRLLTEVEEYLKK